MNRVEVKQKNIDQVMLYNNGAEVTRTVRLKLAAGETVVAIMGLPNAYMSARTAVLGKGAFTVMSVQTKQYVTAEKSEAVQAQESLVQQLQVKQDALAAENAFWLNNLKVGGEAGADAKQLSDAFAFIGARTAESAVMRAQNNAALLAAQTQLSILQQAEMQKGINNQRQSVEITVVADKPCDAELTVNTYTAKASFSLRYEVTSSPETDALTWQLSALAAQTTGEDFENCLTLFSTSSAEHGLNVPEFYPEYVGETQRPTLMRVAQRTYGASELNEEECDYIAANTSAHFTQENESAIHSVFESAKPITLISGAKDAQIQLVQQSVKCAYCYSAMPVFDSGVYLTADVAVGSFPFVAIARLFNDGVFCGETLLSPGTENVCLGRVNKLTATRKTGSRYGSNLFLGGEKTECEYTVTLNSLKKEPVVIKVTDRVPVSQNRAVTVELNELSGAECDKNLGKLVWHVKLKNTEKAVLKVRYTVVNKQKI